MQYRRRVCSNGHIITNQLQFFSDQMEYCPKCGAETIHACPSCGRSIDGQWGRSPNLPPPLQAFCYHCAKPFPWTEKKIEAADELAQELEGLGPDDREILKTSLHDLIQQNPHQEVAELRLAKILRKLDEEGRALAKAVLYGLVTEVVFERLFGS